MSLEDFKSIDASALPIGKLISMISRGHAIYLNHNLKDLDINAAQFHLLFEISNQCDVNQEKIAKRCNINKGSVARSIRKLEDKNLIKREIDSNNRRQNKVSLTCEGEKVLEKSIGIFNNWESEVFKQYTEDEKLLLQKTLKQVVINTVELNKEGSN